MPLVDADCQGPSSNCSTPDLQPWLQPSLEAAKLNIIHFKEFFAMPPSIGSNGEGLVFLLGAPRSGTTLLSVMLDSHPDIASPPEPWLMLGLAALGRVPVRHPANVSVLGTAIRHFVGEDGRILAARAAARALYEAHLERCGKRVFVDKTPRYWLIAEFLISVFPGARFVWLRRDPLDVAASYLSTWNVDLAAIIKQGCDVPELFDLTIGLDRLLAFHERHRETVHVLFYERLVAAASEELCAVLHHIGLDATDATLESMKALAAGARASGALGDAKIRATTAPHSNSVGKWRSVLDRAQLQVLLDAIGAEKLAVLGYADTTAALAAVGVRESKASAGYRATAEARFAAREADMIRAETHGGDDLPAIVQERVHAALAGEEAWAALIRKDWPAVQRQDKRRKRAKIRSGSTEATADVSALGEESAARPALSRLIEILRAAPRRLLTWPASLFGVLKKSGRRM